MAKKISKKEKKMLIALGVVALLGGFMMYRIYAPEEIEATPVEQGSEKKEGVEKKSNSSSRSRSSGGGRRSGGGSSSSTKTPAPVAVSATEFSFHNTPNNCWVSANGVAYDASSYIAKNPSDGADISAFCGTAGFDVGFLKKHPMGTSFLDNLVRKGDIK